MARQQRSVLLLIACISLWSLVSYCSIADQPPSDGATKSDSPTPTVNVSGNYFRPSIGSAEVLRNRGYLAREYNFVTEDNMVMSIVRGTNPLINEGKSGLPDKHPIIFLHGSTLSGASFLAHSVDAKPEDLSHLNVDQLSVDELLRLVGPSGSSQCLPMLAMNLGYEIWIVNRRGFPGSQQKAGAKRTLMEALKDLPRAIWSPDLSGGFSLFGGLTPGRPRNKLLQPAKRSKSNMTIMLTERMVRLVKKPGVKWQDKLKELLLPMVNLPEVLLMLREDETFQREFITTFSPDFWNFSMDEQAVYDVPAMIDFVLGETGHKRLHLVGLSCGGALILMSQADKPELAEKVSKAVLWAPSVHLGSGYDIVYQLSVIVPILQTYIGPLFFTFLTRPAQNALQIFCHNVAHDLKPPCEYFFDLVFGFSGRQAPLMAHTNETCKFSYNTPEKNLEVYGTRRPPCYDFSKIKLAKMSIYVSEYDRLVSPIDVDATLTSLKVPYELNYIKGPELYFSHIGYITHEEANRYAILPSLKDIARAEHEERRKATKVKGGRH